MKTILRRIGFFIATIAALVLLAAIGVYVVSEDKIGATIPVTPETVALPTDSVSLARGRHLARALGKCADCHGDDLGGATIVDDGAMGRWTTPNLTPGGVAAERTDAELATAIRHGVDPKGRRLLLMPSAEYAHLGEADLAALVSYLRSVPRVDRPRASMRYGPVLRALIAFNAAPFFEADRVDHGRKAPEPPPAGVTVEYGAYLARISGCHGCHGETLSGGKIPTGDPAWLPAANLTPTGIGHYSEADFFTLLREGRRPTGTTVSSEMPVKWTREMTDDEIRAVFAYLQSVPPKEFGNR